MDDTPVEDDEPTLALVQRVAPIGVDPSADAWVELVEDDQTVRAWALADSASIVGRSPKATVCIEHGSLSRQHLVIERRDGEYVFTDLDSRNGVFLNGVKAHSAPLRQRDRLQAGDVVLIFYER